jgi:hypothetical protein
MTDEESRLAERGIVVQAAHVADLHGGGVEEPLTRRDHAPRGIPALGVGSRLVALGRDDTVGAGIWLNNWALILLRLGRPLDA